MKTIAAAENRIASSATDSAGSMASGLLELDTGTPVHTGLAIGAPGGAYR